MESWHCYVNSISPDTPPAEVWTKIKRIRRQPTNNIINSIMHNNEAVTESQSIANILANYFQQKSRNHSQTQIAVVSEQKHLPFSNEINARFTIQELVYALSKCKNSAAGPDNLPYIFLKDISDSCRRKLLELYNKIWTNHLFPDSWRESIIFPLRKNESSPPTEKSFRPISLSCAMSKLLERMINKRLTWYLETNALLNPYQSGFRPHRSTMDNLVLLQLEIANAIASVWKPLIVSKLEEFCLNGNLVAFIKNFLDKRRAKVSVNGSTSSTFPLLDGVPQGSVLSPTLFNIAVNDIYKIVPIPINHSLYADDLIIFCSGKNTNTTCKLVQNMLNNLHTWSTATGFNFSEHKSKIMVFERRRNICAPHITLKGTPLQVVSEHTFLGLTFDSGMTWKSASNLKLLDPVQNAAIRLALGALRSSPVEALEIEAHELPLRLRREQLLLNYNARISTNSNNPVTQILNKTKQWDTSSKRPPPVSYTLNELLKDMNHSSNFYNYSTISPPWNRSPAIFNSSLHHFRKQDTLPSIIIQAFHHIVDSIAPDTTLYVDASMTEEGVGWAVTGSHELLLSSRLPVFCSIYSGELFAIYRALSLLEGNGRTFVICTDSLAAVQSIKNLYSSHPLVQSIQDRIQSLTLKECKTHIVWIPSHIGIVGNECADRNAVCAARSHPKVEQIYFLNDVKRYYQLKTEQNWQNIWTLSNAKLARMVPTLLPFRPIQLSRRDTIIIRRIRIGHTRLTHAHLMKRYNLTNCDHCNIPISVKYIMKDCPKYNKNRAIHQIREDHLERLHLTEVQGKTIEYLKSIELYNLI
ncbi:uncharacterized protein [Euwallacea similis]|uniref:uncharacterized protein n=1 Tax=Euwallacea similis TaxID=1736056 RepID=UPI00344B1BA6